MILRRVMAHVEAQNWTAVALDFVIVVVGVFIGIQVANWNAARATNARAIGYLERINDDLSLDIQFYEFDIEFRKIVAANGDVALSATGPSGDIDTDWRTLTAFFNASQLSGRPNIDTTYAELISSGELALIANIELRGALSRYYTLGGSNPVLHVPPDYRATVRGMITVDIQRGLWRDCYRADGDAAQEFLACDPGASLSEISAVVERLTSSQKLRDELTYWMSTQEVALLVLDGRREQAIALQALVEAELGRRDDGDAP